MLASINPEWRLEFFWWFGLVGLLTYLVFDDFVLGDADEMQVDTALPVVGNSLAAGN